MPNVKVGETATLKPAAPRGPFVNERALKDTTSNSRV